MKRWLYVFMGGIVLTLCVSMLPVGAADDAAWRSRLYPEDWGPGFKAENGDFLRDFSYAGYHRGERPLPDFAGRPTFDVTSPQYGADSSGETDSTAAIQQAIAAAGAAGGGVVYLPEGTYRVSRPEGSNATLLLDKANVVLRGAGPERTRLFNATQVMRGSAVVRVAGGGGWRTPVGEEYPLREDVEAGAFEIKVEGGTWQKGDWIVLTHDATKAFVAEHLESLVRPWAGRVAPIIFYRQIKAVGADGALAIDIPTRYYLKTRDNARVHRVRPHIEEVGIEELSIGMQEHTGEGWGFNSYRNRGTGAHDVHASYMIDVSHVVNGWIRNVHTYRPETNKRDRHILSNGIRLFGSRSITVVGCNLQQAQYRGGGGNGYGYVLQSNDCLIQDSRGRGLRYVFDFKQMLSNGNVIHRGESHGTSDFHMHLSVANLIDNVHMTHGAFNARSRGGVGTIAHGMTTKDSVFWNLRGSGGGGGAVIDVRGQPYGSFVVGTSGTRTRVYGSRRIEGVGRGETLEPQSLYEDQLARRLGGLRVSATADARIAATAAYPLGGAAHYATDAVRSQWRQIGGPAVAFADEHALDTTVDLTKDGVYTFELRAWDGDKTDRTRVTIVVDSVPPLVLRPVAQHFIRGKAQRGSSPLGYFTDAGGSVGTTGSRGSRTDNNAIIGFKLPEMPEGRKVDKAVFHFEIRQARDSTGGGNLPDLHVYLLDTEDPKGTETALFYHGSQDSPDNGTLAASTGLHLSGTGTANFARGRHRQSLTLSEEALAHLQGLYDAGTPKQSKVYFRFNLSEVPSLSDLRRYVVRTEADASELVLFTSRL